MHQQHNIANNQQLLFPGNQQNAGVTTARPGNITTVGIGTMNRRYCSIPNNTIDHSQSVHYLNNARNKQDTWPSFFFEFATRTPLIHAICYS